LPSSVSPGYILGSMAALATARMWGSSAGNCMVCNGRVQIVTVLTMEFPHERDSAFFASLHVFRSLGAEYRFGIVPETGFPYILDAPSDIGPDCLYCCFYGVGWKDLTLARLSFSAFEARFLDDIPTCFNAFNHDQYFAAETIGHECRHLACFETDATKRTQLLERALRIYHRLALAYNHVDPSGMYNAILKDPSKVILRFFPDEQTTPFVLRRLSHIFAGMAVCELLGQERPFAKYLSLASLAVGFGGLRALELACVLRTLPQMLACYWSDRSDGPHLFDLGQHVTERVLLPLMVQQGRRDLFAVELDLVQRVFGESRRRDCKRFAVDIIGRGPQAESGCMLDDMRKCAACGTVAGDLRCARCRKVFYCGKECQRAHWREHKADCGIR
jgi:hypothetical protein